MPAVNRLIKKIASHPSTEELILFIANDDEIVKECLRIQDLLDNNNSRELNQLASLCRSRQISLEDLAREIRRILAIFSPGSVDDEYAILGLKPGADLEQIKKAFRRLSIKYHPDASGSDTSARFIKICQAYKSIVSRSASSTGTPGSDQSSRWHYKKKHGPSGGQKRKNILLFSSLAAILLVISMVMPFIYKKKVMLKHLNKSDPILSEKTIEPEPLKKKTAEKPLHIQPIEAPVAKNLTQLPKAALPEPVQQSRPQKPATVETAMEREPAVPVTVKEEIVQQPPESPVQQLKPAPVVTAAEKSSQPQPPHIPVVLKPTTQKQHLKTAKSRVAANKQPAGTINQVTLNQFIRNYTTTYENKNFHRFSRFFTSDALENGHPFTAQHNKYIKLFNSVDTITLNIGILSSTIKDENIKLKGRFQINLTYPQRQSIQRKGQIFFLLTDNDQQYKVKELRYTFDKTD